MPKKRLSRLAGASVGLDEEIKTAAASVFAS
jgi:hypothetical protein